MIFTLKCQICGKEFTSKNKNKKYCSNECHKKGVGAAYIKSIEEKYGSYENFEKHRAEVRKPLSIEAKQAKCEKIKASVIEHYGSYENFYKHNSELFKEKHGVENPYQLDAVKSKIKKTCLERYGDECFVRSKDGNKKLRDSLANLTEDQLEAKNKKREETCLAKYNVSHPMQIDSVKEKLKRTCVSRYGVDNISKLPENREQAMNTCYERYGVKMKSNEGLESLHNRFKDIRERFYENFDFSSFGFTYIGNSTIKCNVCGDERLIDTPPSLIGQQLYCKKCNQSKNASAGEVQMLNYIRGIYSGDVISGDWSVLGNRELDIYVPAKKLAIEFDGIYWHSGNENKKKMLEKTIACEKKGISLMHIFDLEWNEKQDLIKAMIASRIIAIESIGARKCLIKEVSTSDYKDFITKNHFQGFAAASVKLGLFYKGQLVQIMSFAKTRFSKKYEYEMIRECSLSNLRVVGGKAKLLKYFKDNYNPSSIISYCDRRLFTGKSYTDLGFKEEKPSTQAYYYYNYKYGQILYNRMTFQKKKLKDLPYYSESATEQEIMEANGFLRIYDCGQKVFTWQRLQK